MFIFFKIVAHVKHIDYICGINKRKYDTSKRIKDREYNQ